jgi:hypothetical protein
MLMARPPFCRCCGSSTSHAVSCGCLPWSVWLSGFTLCLHPRPYALELHSSPVMASALVTSTAMRFLLRLPNPWPCRKRAVLPLPPPSLLTWRPLAVTVSADASRSAGCWHGVEALWPHLLLWLWCLGADGGGGHTEIRRMLQVYVSSISDILEICCKCFICMLQT